MVSEKLLDDVVGESLTVLLSDGEAAERGGGESLLHLSYQLWTDHQQQWWVPLGGQIRENRGQAPPLF